MEPLVQTETKLLTPLNMISIGKKMLQKYSRYSIPTGVVI